MKVRGIAHRGYSVKYPENTLSSYQAACDLGFEILELDAHLSKDGIPVLMHDATIDRMTDGEGWIKDYTVEELKRFRVGENETIPTLEEALRLVKGKMIVSIELKQKGYRYPGLEQAVVDVIRKVDMLDQVYIIGFDHYAVARMRQLNNQIELGLVLSGASPAVFSFMKKIRANYLAVGAAYITEEYVRACQEHGVQLIAWTVNTEQQIREMLRYPSVLCTTDELELFKSIYETTANTVRNG
ncbi:MAG TPA: glycerophosphodiester phosphodiesterase family protein [Bacillales bacterium]